MLGGVLAIAGPSGTTSLAAETPPATAPASSVPVLDWNTGANKSYVIPAVEISGFLTALNIFNRSFLDKSVYGTTLRGTWDNFRNVSLDYDDDPFTVNQFGHPTMGALMYGSARSTGLNFWQSLVYSNVGSFVWEVAGETGKASFNDLITTSQAGSLLGESLFRMASLVLEKGGRRPGFWRELGAAVIMPSLGFDRLLHGERFKPIFPSHNPPTFWQLRLGASVDARATDNKFLSTVKRQEALLDFSMTYGMPGQPGYTYDRPFDYFQFELGSLSSAHTHNWLEHIFCRGLLWGKELETGDNFAGVFGLYGNYDFASPQIFRVSSTAASLGTTCQWWLSRKVALQGTVLTGVGFGGAGTNPIKGLRDYHYGVTPQGLGTLRLIFGDRAMLELTGRGYYISGTGSDDLLGTETIARGQAGVTVRIYGRNAIGLQFVGSHRVSHYNDRPTTHQSVGTFSLTYSYLSETGFGAVGSHR